MLEWEGACFYLQFVEQLVHLRKNKMLSTEAAVALVILECSFCNSRWYIKNRRINRPSLSCWLGAWSHLSQRGILEHLLILIALGQQYFHLASLNINSTALKLLYAYFSCVDVSCSLFFQELIYAPTVSTLLYADLGLSTTLLPTNSSCIPQSTPSTDTHTYVRTSYRVQLVLHLYLYI